MVPGIGEIDKDDIVRGYEAEPGNYVLLEDDEPGALKLEARHTFELTRAAKKCCSRGCRGAGLPPDLVNIVMALIETGIRPFWFDPAISDVTFTLVCADKSRGH